MPQLRGRQEGQGQDQDGNDGESLCSAFKVSECILVTGWKHVLDSQKKFRTENTNLRAA